MTSEKQPKLTILVVAHNEEEDLDDCLQALGFGDELMVVLDKCTDGSKSIAEKYADTIIEGRWDIEGPRRHAGLDVCKGDWVLEVDADERVSLELAAEVKAAIQTAPFGHFLIPYDNYVGKTLVRYGWGGSWGVSATVRLFSKG
ncbi:MAG: glycosyltransferase, partial [Magnetovibrio sp.]|nr:glycosyltransferase [Magnetovibrio sp.]